jgi:hypothetical protein
MTPHSRFLDSASRPVSRWALLCLPLFCCVALWAQDSGYQRSFSISVDEAKAAVQTVSATSRGRLPTLEGFVQQTDLPIDRLEKGYYECTFQISAAAGGTVVRATTKITAWYNDPDATRSGYRVLTSNGRLETDALDRIAEGVVSKTSSVATPKFGASAPTNLRLSAPAPHVPLDQTFSVPAGTAVESVKATRTEDEKKSADLSNYIKNLEDIQRNQAHPNDLAAVKTPKAAVFSKPAENAQILMNAEAHDEFPVLAVDGSWVHVQISGVSRGWIHRAQLEMPVGFSQADAGPAQNPSGTAGIFQVAKEETSPFSGSWAPLKGKPVRIEWVKPVNPGVSSSQKEKLAFAKSIFLQVSSSMNAAQPNPEGIVVVFDSADGGQIAAALSSVKALANRTLSDSAFWHQCSLDPPESFLDSAAR